MNRIQRSFWVGIAMALAGWGAAWGQAISSPQFNLSTPGARSLGMGGAFLALADDATAAYTNPAGLTNLIAGGPQVAVELRNWDYSTPYFAEGRLSGRPNFFGLDASPGLNVANAESEVSDLSFASFAYILPRGYTVALYKNQIAHFVTAFQSEGLFYDASGSSAFVTVNGNNPTLRTLPLRVATRVQVDSIGGSIAYEIRKPLTSKIEQPLSIGIGIAQYRLDLRMDIQNYNFKDFTSQVDGFFGRSQFLPGDMVRQRKEAGDDTALAFNYGFLWKLGKRQNWAVGGVYREGPSFTTRRLDSLSGTAEFSGTLKIPDIYGLGVSYSPPNSAGRTKVALDYQNIRYSQRLEDFFVDQPAPFFEIPDDQELHLGVERVVWTSGKIVGTVRAGGWHETAHELRYTGSDTRTQALYPGGRDDNHWSLGLGLVIGEEYQIDSAVDRSDRVNTLSFSIVKFF